MLRSTYDDGSMHRAILATSYHAAGRQARNHGGYWLGVRAARRFPDVLAALVVRASSGAGRYSGQTVIVF